MDNSSCKKLTVLFVLLSIETTFGASIFGLNFGSLRDAAANNIEQVPKFFNRVIHRHKQHSAEKNTFQDNRETADNERVAFPFADTQPAKYEDQQNWGYDNPTTFPDNRGNTDYYAYKPTFSPSPNKYPQRQESGYNSPISFTDNIGRADYNGYKNTFNPATNSFVPTSSHYVNKVTPGNNLNYASGPVNIGSRGSFYGGGENSKPLLPDDAKMNPADAYLSEHAAASDSDSTTEYSTITDYDWTTTDEPLNRIGAPPAVVASILG